MAYLVKTKTHYVHNANGKLHIYYSVVLQKSFHRHHYEGTVTLLSALVELAYFFLYLFQVKSKPKNILKTEIMPNNTWLMKKNTNNKSFIW